MPSGLHVHRLIIGGGGGGHVQRTAHVLDDHIGLLGDGQLNIAGRELKFGLVHPPIEVQLIHLIADVHLARVPGDLRGHRGQELQTFVELEVLGGRLSRELTQHVLPQLGVQQHLAMLGIGGRGGVGRLLALLRGLLLGAHGGGHHGIAGLKGVDVQLDGPALDAQTAVIAGNLQVSGAPGIFQLGMRHLHLDLNGYGFDFNQWIHSLISAPL